MKRILLIGSANPILADMNNFLSQYFIVQPCTDNLESLEGVLRLVTPDLAIVSLIGSSMTVQKFDVICQKILSVPIVTMGTEYEKNKYASFYRRLRLDHVNRPVDNSILMRVICGRLGLNPSDVKREAATVHAAEINSSKKKILLVDDDPAMLRNVKHMLDGRYEVSVVTSGTKAIGMIAVKRPDLILLDYEMPVCDGKQTLERQEALH